MRIELVDSIDQRLLGRGNVIVESHIANLTRGRRDHLRVLYGRRGNNRSRHCDSPGPRGAGILHRERVLLTIVRVDPGIEHIDTGLGVVVDVHAVDFENSCTARQRLRQVGCRRVGFRIRDAKISWRRVRQECPLNPIASLRSRLCQLLPLIRVVGEMELVLGLPRRR